MPTPIQLTDTKVNSIRPGPKREEYRDALAQGLRLRVGQSGKKTWIIRARSGDKVLNKTLGTYPAMGVGAARTAAGKALETIAQGTAEDLDRTFGQVAAAWIEKVAKPKNASAALQERRLELHVLPAWRDKKIRQIRKADVRDLIENLEGDVLPNMVLALVRPIFRYALERDWVEVSPAEGIRKPKPETARDRVLSMDEIARIWRAAEHLGFPFSQYVRVLLLTGQRRTEVASMRWDNVDLDAGTWTLGADETKGGRGHLVPLPLPATETLKAMPRLGKAGFVFTTNGESPVSSYAAIKRKLDAFIAADGGAPMEPWVFHDLRRSAATHMVRLGVLMEIVGRVLNHAVTGVTAKVYALHDFAAEKRSALDRWAADVMRAVEGGSHKKVVKLRSGR